MLSYEPPIIAALDQLSGDSRLRVSVFRFNIQAATFELVRESDFVPLNR